MSYDNPIIIGGLAGSGTRAFVKALEPFISFGTNLLYQCENRAISNKIAKWKFSHFKASIPIGILKDFSKSTGENYLDLLKPNYNFKNEYKKAVYTLYRDIKESKYWGYKHPETMYLLDFLADEHPDMKYIHVVRDGRDMAFHPHITWFTPMWAFYYTPKIKKIKWEGNQISPEEMIEYWDWANNEANYYMNTKLENKYIVVRFEDLCRCPGTTIIKMLRFLNISFEADLVGKSVQEIIKPKTIGRYKSKDKTKELESIAKESLMRYNYI